MSVCLRLKSQGDGESEGGTDASLAFDADLAPHQLGQLAADSQPQARSAVSARGGGVALLEAAEQLGKGFGSDADAGVGDAETEGPSGSGDVHPDLPGLGELQGVGDQVVENLAHPDRIAEIDPFGRWLDLQVEAQALLGGDGGEGGVGAAGQILEVELRLFEVELAGLDKVEIPAKAYPEAAVPAFELSPVSPAE